MEKETKRQQNLDYINNKINPIFEKLIVELLLHKPENIVHPSLFFFFIQRQKENFMIDWLSSHKAPVVSLPIQEKKPSKNHKSKEEDENSDSDESEGEELLEIPSKKSPMNKGRSSVSAEAYGLYHKKGAFTPKVVMKNQDQKERIIKRLGQAFMFQALDDKEKEIVVNAMEEKKFKLFDFHIF